MMNKKRMWTVLGSAAVMFLAGGIAIGGADKDGPDTAKIDVIEGSKGAVELAHKKHAKEIKTADGKSIECVTCHHTAKGGGKVQACGACHVADGQAQKEHDGKKAPFFATMKSPGKADTKSILFHKTCLDGCHKAQAKADPKLKDLAKCTSCHKK